MADSDEGTPLPGGTEIFETDAGVRYTAIDGELYIEASDGDFYHEDMFAAETDEPATDDSPPSWAQPLLEKHALETEDDVRADERARIEAEEEEEESPLVEWLLAHPRVLEKFDDFQYHADAAGGDLALALQRFDAGEAKLEDARRDLNINQPKSIDDAMTQWFDERHQAQRVDAAEQAAAPRTAQGGEHPSSLRSAIDDFADELSASRAVDVAARQLVTEQERRGR
jgi:hypothetical protein